MTAKAKIFIVEDDPFIVMDMRQALTEQGYEVVGAADTGEEAVQSIASTKPSFVLMDIGLKGKMDGIETAAKVTATYPVPIVFLTGLTDETTLQRAKLTYPYGFLIKPFDPIELRSTIELTMHRYEHERSSDSDRAAEQEEEKIVYDVGEGNLDEKMQFLSHLEIFKGVPPNELRTLAESANVHSFDAGEYLAMEGNEPKGGFIMLSGKVSIIKSAISGKELIVSMLGPGDVFGLFYLLKGFHGASSARTQFPSRVLWVTHSAFSKLQQNVPQFAQNMNEALGQRLVRSYALASSLAHARVEDRIVTTILTLLPELGKSTNGSESKGRILITRKELADLTGTTPETAIRVTKNLEREGCLDLTRPGIIKIVDKEKLRAISSS